MREYVKVGEAMVCSAGGRGGQGRMKRERKRAKERKDTSEC